MKKVIGIDLGTTSISGVVLDVEEEKVLVKQTIPGGKFLETGKQWEKVQDAEEIIEKAEGMIGEFLERYPDAEAIGIDCQMHGILYLDKMGRALSPLFTWQDGRGELLDESEQTTVNKILEVTGEHAASGYGLVTHIYNQKHDLVPEGAAVICTIGDYLGMRLTGRTAPLMHASNAASLGLFDSEHGHFYVEKLEKMGVFPEILPEVTADVKMIGEYQGRPVFTAIGDNQASFLGSVGLKGGTVLVNIGTGSQVSVLTEEYVEIPGMDTRPIAEKKWLLVGASLCGGRAYAILEQFFRMYVQAERGTEQVPRQYEIMGKLAQQVWEEKKGADLKVCTLFSGTRENPALRGSITGIGVDDFTPGEVILGTMEGMIEELFEAYQKMTEATGRCAKELIMSGNGLRRNQILQAITEKRFELPSLMSGFEEEAACGAALSVVVYAWAEDSKRDTQK